MSAPDRRRRIRRALLLPALLLALAGPVAAVVPSEVLLDAGLEARARQIGKELRCLVCQNQSIDDSDADLAKDLRIIVRERLVAGDSDEKVFRYVVDRYGDYVLLKPPFKLSTYALWFGPLVILGAAVLAALGFYRRATKARELPLPLSGDEEHRLSLILRDDS